MWYALCLAITKAVQGPSKSFPLYRDRGCAGHLLSRSFTARVPTHEDDTHDDFKPKFKPEAEPRHAPTVQDQIKADISGHSVFLYMKVPFLG